MIHKISKWQNDFQAVYCLSDFHAATQPHNLLSNQQRNTIIRAAKAHNAHVIAEDALRHFNLERSNKQLYVAPYLRLVQLTPNQASLLGLSSLCYYAGIPHSNIEFRLGATAAYNNGHAASKVLAHTNEAIERIKNYDDGPIANAWYKKILNEYDQLSNGPAQYFLEQLRAKGDEPISRALLESIPHTPDIQAALKQLNSDFEWNKMDWYSQKLVLLMLFDNKLLDAELIHALIQCKDKKTVFVCAGSEHIDRLLPVLEELGYKKIISKGDDLIAQDIRYQEPTALTTTELSSLLESKKTTLPLLLRINWYIQSLLDSKNAHRWIGLILYYSILVMTISILSLTPFFANNTALWHRMVIGIVLSQAICWYLAQPRKKKCS